MGETLAPARSGNAHFHEREAGAHRLWLVLALVVLYMGAELVGGWLTGSLALLADAGHMLSDAASLGLALAAIRLARRPRTPERTFGLHRTEILAALANGLLLVAVAVAILFEAWNRFRSPHPIDGRSMMWIAVGGLGVNLLGLRILHGSRGSSLNLRGVWLHVLADALGSVQAIAAGVLVWRLGWLWADPLASVLIALLVAGSAWRLLVDSVHVLLEGTPAHLDEPEIRSALLGVAGIVDVHDLHVWTITSGFDALSVHACVAGRDRDAVLEEARTTLRDRFALDHATIQIESAASCAGACAEDDHS
jgi:cobalt-zinc-cadmium efflux system protein